MDTTGLTRRFQFAGYVYAIISKWRMEQLRSFACSVIFHFVLGL